MFRRPKSFRLKETAAAAAAEAGSTNIRWHIKLPIRMVSTATATASANHSRGGRRLEVAVLVSGHLGQAENGEAALEAVVVCLLVGVRAAVDAAVLRRRELLESGGQDRVGFLVLPPVGHHFVRVRAHKVALETVEVRRFILHRTYYAPNLNI